LDTRRPGGSWSAANNRATVYARMPNSRMKFRHGQQDHLEHISILEEAQLRLRHIFRIAFLCISFEKHVKSEGKGQLLFIPL